jgi:predicted ester cyclase
MRLNKPRLYAYLLCLCFGTFSEQVEAQMRDALNSANLVTISALTNARTEFADSINRIPQLFFQIATLIDEQGEITSRRTSDNTLVNAVEKFSFVAKGVFKAENALGIKSYELAVTAESRIGRLALYSDSTFQLSFVTMRWRKIKDGSHFTLKRLISSQVKEETLRLDLDGSGCYEVALDRKPTLFLKWDASGKITTRQRE